MNKRVLVVDDSASVRQQVAATLREAGFEITEATDGVDGIQKLESDPTLALIVCDVNMPRMNGIEMIESLRRNDRFATIPILMLTSEGQPSLIERAKKVGAKGWIVKPFKPGLLLAAVQKILAG